MKDKSGNILYVGKASSLRKRVGSYFHGIRKYKPNTTSRSFSVQDRPSKSFAKRRTKIALDYCRRQFSRKPPGEKIQDLLQRTTDIDYIQTTSSAQALLLENSLIKRYKPHYNAALKDDKSYPFVKLSAKEDYPPLSIVRGRREKGARYYGPYTNVKLLKAAVKTLRPIFPFRSCKRFPKKPCLYFHLKLCPGMCAVKVSKKVYGENLRQLELFLEGRGKELLEQLQDKMCKVAEDEHFEEAALIRDKINSLNEIIAQTKEPKPQDLISELKKVLKLPRTPYRIEAFDISQIRGSGLAGSMVSFLGGWPDKKNYRKFRIKTVRGIDDYAMIREVLQRRYRKLSKGNMPTLPDLVMIDGGKGHLSSAQKELKSLGLLKLPVVALAKRLETIYTPSGKEINLPKDSKLLHLLQKIRDEAHRFAISYHRKLRRKDIRMSQLDAISGIGRKRKQELLRHFKSVQAIKQASLEDLLQVKSMNRKAAKGVLQFFSTQGL